MTHQQFLDFLAGISTTQKSDFLTLMGISASTDETLAGEIIKTETMAKAMSGDMVFVCSPAESERAYTDLAMEGYIYLETADGDVHTWYNGTITSGITVTEVTNGNGTVHTDAAFQNTTKDAVFINGRCYFELYFTGTWAADDTATLTIALAEGGNILGYDVADATSVTTFISEG